MKRGFTLIEIIVSITIMALISGGALVYLNKFISQQKLERGTDEVISALKLAQSYAKTRQLPVDSTETELKYVRVEAFSGGLIVAGANGIGSTYFSYQVGGNSLLIGIVPTPLFFWRGNGFLSKDINGTMYGINETATIIVESNNDVVGYNQIILKSLGQITLNSYTGVSNFSFPVATLTPAPTSTPGPTSVPGMTSTPAPSATVTPSFCLPLGSACITNSQCCSYYCNNMYRRCLSIEPTERYVTPTIRYVTPTTRYLTPTIRYVTPTIIYRI